MRLGDPKRSVPTLEIPAPVVQALRGHELRQLEERKAVGEAWPD
jgi:hypothetical protein